MNFRTLARLFCFVFLGTVPSFSQYANIVAKLTDGTGSASSTAFLHFDLQNCGVNFPSVSTGNLTVTQTTFDIHPSQPDGSILGSVLGNDVILCGNVASTFYHITPMKDANTPLGPGQDYLICAIGAPSVSCYPGIGGNWNPALAQPMIDPAPPPGFILVFSNPLLGQYISQPVGTSFLFNGLGTFDFSALAPAQLVMPQKADLVGGFVPQSELGSGIATALTCLIGGSGSAQWSACPGGGGGSGTVLQLNPATAAGSLYPLFTFGFSNQTTNPVLAFSLSSVGAHRYFGNTTSSTAAPAYFNIGTGDLPFTYSGSTTTLATVDATFSGTGSTICTDGSLNLTTACPSPSTGNVTTTPTSGTSQNIFQLPVSGTVPSTFGANIFNYIYYVPPPAIAVTTGGANWQQSPSGTISAGSNTVTLNPSPPGLMTATQETFNHNWTRIRIAGTGTPEAVLLTGSTCPDQGGAGSCTITFTAVNPHSAGFTAGSGSGGLQETINASQRCYLTYSCASHVAFGKMVIPPGDYTVVARVVINNANSYSNLDFTGTTVTCNLSDTCIFVGDPTATNQSLDTTISNITARPAISNGNYPFIEDHSNALKINGLYTFTGGGSTSFGTLVQNDVDENLRIEHMDTNSAGTWSHCSTDFCSSAVYVTAGSPAPLTSISHSNINMGCHGNGVDNWGGNTLSISDTQIQGYNQFGIRSISTYNTNSNLVANNVYQEIAGCTNPLGTGIAGVVAQDGSVSWNGGVGPQGKLPLFANTGSTTNFNYYVVACNSTNCSPPYPIGYDKSDGSTAIPVTFPEFGTTGPPTYSIIRTSGTSPGGPTTATCGGGSVAACGSVTTGLTQAGACSNGVCTYSDNPAASTTAFTFSTPTTNAYYPVLIGTYGAGGRPPLGGNIVLSGNENASKDGQTFAYFVSPSISSAFGSSSTTWSNNGPLGIISALGAAFPTVYSSMCQNGYLWMPLWVVCDSTNAVDFGARLFQMGGENTGETAIYGTQGKNIFTAPPGINLRGGHIITLANSNPAATLADPSGSLYRETPWNALDAAIMMDIPSGSTVAPNAVPIAFSSPVSLSNYIGAVGDGTSWLERLTASAKTINVNTTVNGNLTVTGTCTGCTGSFSYPAAGITVSTGSGWGTSLTAPTGAIVGNSDTQTLTNKSIAGSEINSSTVGATYGGTGADTHTSTGVAQVSSGTWSISTALPNGTTATTQSASSNDTKVATDAYVDTGLALKLNAASGIFTGTPDASGATEFKLPIAAGFATLANGELGYDTTNKNWHGWQNGADNLLALFSGAIVNGHCAQITISTSIVTLTDAGGACGTSAMVYPAGAGIPIVVGGVSWGTTLSSTDGNMLAGVSGAWTKVTALPNGITATTQTALSADTKVATDNYVDRHFIASGSTALGTTIINSGTCATVATATATGTLTTDIVRAGFNGDPTGVTGYLPSTSGMLTIIPYPTADTANFKVCNNTASNVTPGALTINWQVIR